MFWFLLEMVNSRLKYKIAKNNAYNMHKKNRRNNYT